MFGFGKQKKNKPTTAAPEDSANIDIAVDKVLLGYMVSGQSLASYVRQIDREADKVTLVLALPIEQMSTATSIQQGLAAELHPHGINEVNLTLIRPKTSNSPQPKSLPPTINAAQDNNNHQTSTASDNQNKPPSRSTTTPKTPPKQSEIPPHPRIKHILVIASGKGGVGKSTTAVNIALALKQQGHQVGVLDADIYGPSIPTMLGVENQRPEVEDERFVPIEAYGMAVLSIGNLLEGQNTPIAWRGPKATGALMQLFSQTNWPALDYLVIDMPPGTGDIQLTLAQRIPITAAIIVTTPQDIALLDAIKGIEMFKKVNIPVLGVVENMAMHQCANCGHQEHIFGQGGGEQLTDTYQVELLGQLPLASAIREQTDKGQPSVIAEDKFAQYYLDIATKIEADITPFVKVDNSGRIF